jgi:hypothetical protein
MPMEQYERTGFIIGILFRLQIRLEDWFEN